jgi:hypothetical protein
VISSFDDYALHQTSEPINQPAQSDRNFYDRYWFNGFDRDGALVFEVGFGLYPNRYVMDGHLSVVRDGVQQAFHASRRAPRERAESRIGPLSIEIEQPLRIVRVRLDDNDSGLSADLRFRATTAPTQEPKNVMREDGRLIMDTSRFTQFGTWEGHVTQGGVRQDVSATRTLGTRDRSWGVRPVGEPPGGAPSQERAQPGVYWVWSPIHFDDVCTQFGSFEDPEGRPTQLSAAIVPRYRDLAAIPRGEDPGHREMADARHTIEWEPGTRRAQAAQFTLTAPDGEAHEIQLTPIARFQMLGIGYQHPEWAHGVWHGEEAFGFESWKQDALDPLDYKHIHVHQICRARMGAREGVGTLETVVFGRHARSGFQSILDGAPERR